ncbi:MAG: hypothetical protein QOJ12_3271, partial [Thermoleophilales bacterium]|nr:hypothetical protein [Thermoleophilales bacterium]
MLATQDLLTPAAHDDLVVRDLRSSDFDDAAAVIGRGIRDNPVHVAAYGLEPRRRQMIHTRLMRAYMSDNHQNDAIGVW